jgi:hypothetical protein
MHNKIDQFSHFRYTIQWHLSVSTVLCNHHHYFQNIFIFQNRIYPLKSNSALLSSPRPWYPLFCFLSLWICLFWVLPRSGTIQYLSFCIWIIQLSIFQCSSICLVTCMRILILIKSEKYSVVCTHHILFIHSMPPVLEFIVQQGSIPVFTC